MRKFSAVMAIGIVLGGVALAQEIYHESNGDTCDMDGTATSPAGKALNEKKNRFEAPKASDIDSTVSLTSMLAPADDVSRFDDTKGATIRGFVVDVKTGGKETCNCKASASVDKDTHIELVLSSDAPEIQRVIVEVTPRLRAKMQAQGVDWSTQTLKSSQGIKGKWIEVTGWLMFDSMHVNEAENTNPGGNGNWRATCWEIHPITGMTVLDTPPTESPSGLHIVHPDVFMAMRSARIADLKRNPEERAKQQKRNQEILAKFAADELDKEELPEGLHPTTGPGGNPQ